MIVVSVKSFFPYPDPDFGIQVMQGHIRPVVSVVSFFQCYFFRKTQDAFYVSTALIICTLMLRL